MNWRNRAGLILLIFIERLECLVSYPHGIRLALLFLDGENPILVFSRIRSMKVAGARR